VSEPEGRGAAWTEERGTSDEGRRRLKGAPQASGDTAGVIGDPCEEAGAMAELKAEADPAEVGFDPARLDRVDQHFRRYVDDGRLPGWLLIVSRHGRLAHVSGYGARAMEAGRPDGTRTPWGPRPTPKPAPSASP